MSKTVRGALLLLIACFGGCAEKRYSLREVREYDTAIKMAEARGIETAGMHDKLVEMLVSYLRHPGVDPEVQALQDSATAQEMQALNGFLMVTQPARQPDIPPMSFGEWLGR